MSLITLPASIDGAAADLRHRIVGDVLVPTDDGFAAACAAWNLCFTHDPAVVVIAGATADITEAVRFARAGGHRVAIQATGHGIARPAADGVLIVTSRLTDVTIDVEARTAHVSCGAKWGAVLAPAQEHGLAPLLGSTTDVGAIGYTLGGGMGWLGRRYGLASDSVRSFDLVLPDGTEVHTSAAEQPELFWALKGGGGGTFGVVTSMEIELYPVSTVYAGNLLYPVEMAAEVIARYRTWVVEGIDEHLTSAVLIMNFPPLDIVPEPIRGQSFVIVRGCWSGDLAEGQRLIDTWRTWRTPAVDMFGPMPFSAADTISNDPVDPIPAMVSTEWFDTLPDAAIDTLVAATVPDGEHPPMLLFSELRHAGGRVRANAAGAANDRGRAGELLLEMVGMVFGPENGEALADHIGRTRQELAPFVTGAAYVNFLEGPEKHERSATAYSDEHMARLQAVKDAVDGDGRFCHGVDIAPTR